MTSRRSFLRTAAAVGAAALARSRLGLARPRPKFAGPMEDDRSRRQNMADLKAAFEKENPEITLTLVDSPFPGFHDKAIMFSRPRSSPTCSSIQVDWVAEYADLGMLEPLDDWLAKRTKSVHGQHLRHLPQEMARKQYYLPVKAARRAFLEHRGIQKRGIAGPPKTWDEYAQVAKKVTNPEAKIFATTATLRSSRPRT